jgi:hypothetical protein
VGARQEVLTQGSDLGSAIAGTIGDIPMKI